MGFLDPSALVGLFLSVGFLLSFVALLLALGLPVFPWGLSRCFADVPEEGGVKAARCSEGGQQPGRSPVRPQNV